MNFVFFFQYRTYELIKSLASTDANLLGQFGISPLLIEQETKKRDKAKELEVNI